MKNKKIIIMLISIILVVLLGLISYAENKDKLELTTEYIYDSSNNVVTVVIHSNNIINHTKPTWKLGSDKITYTKVLSVDTEKYTTPVQDIYGNIVNVEINVSKAIKPEIIFKIEGNASSTVTGIIKSNIKMKNTKPTWKLSEDQLTYTKELPADIQTYTTPIETINGEIINVEIKIEKSSLKLNVGYTYNEDKSEVLVKITSNNPLANTKSTWNLSADKLTYSKTIDVNRIYTTPVQDIYGNVQDAKIEITKLIPKINVSYKYNSNKNIVTVTMESNVELANTKPTWNLSDNNYKYSKEFNINQAYTTPVQDIYGNIVIVTIKITQIPPKISVNYNKNNDGTVTVVITSNQELADTKPTWNLSENKLQYSKTFDTNQTYTTPVQDIYGNIVTVSINARVKNIINIDDSKYPGYKELIEKLMEQHPTWNFKLLYTGLTFDEVIRGEAAVHSRNLIPPDYAGEWICSVCGTRKYDSGWYCASEKAIAYYMDPRNYLNETDVFQFLDLNNYSEGSVSLEGIQAKIDGSFLNDYAVAINNACKNTNVNPYYIIARLIQEQGYSGTTIGRGMDGGDGKTYYNPFNIGATGNGYSEIYANALETAKNYGWDSMQKAIEGGISFCKKNWLENYQNTLYQNKFDIDTTNGSALYEHQYMQNLFAAQSEGHILRNMYVNTNKVDSNFIFVIPVYENMSRTKSSLPSNNSEVSPMNFKVTAESGLNIRSEANSNSTIIKLVPKGEVVLSVQRGINSSWQKVVLNDGTIGFMSGAYLEQVDDVVNCYYAAIVKTEDGIGCNIRVGPSIYLDKITALSDGTWVIVINEGTYNIDGYNWVRILLSDGRQAFMPINFLSK